MEDTAELAEIAAAETETQAPQSLEDYIQGLGLGERQAGDIARFDEQLKGKAGVTEEDRNRLVEQRIKMALDMARLKSADLASRMEFSAMVEPNKILFIDQNQQPFEKIAAAVEKDIVDMQQKGVRAVLLPVTSEALEYMRDKARAAHPYRYGMRIRRDAINPNDPDMAAMEKLLDSLDAAKVEVRPLVSNPNAMGDEIKQRNKDAWENDPQRERDFPGQQIVREFADENNQVKGAVVAIMKTASSYFGGKPVTPDEVREDLGSFLGELNLESGLKTAKLNPTGTLRDTTPTHESPQTPA